MNLRKEQTLEELKFDIVAGEKTTPLRIRSSPHDNSSWKIISYGHRFVAVISRIRARMQLKEQREEMLGWWMVEDGASSGMATEPVVKVTDS
ncbi:hypothetical protein TNCV_1099661 [Trichonephila clavipes]|nr:hypothetical protein TNCV_1099661 [Trichonephila clavipes]